MNKIDLSNIDIVNESSFGGAEKLFNQQLIAGDPLSDNGGKPGDFWQPSQDDSHFPIAAYIDLKDEYDVSHIAIYDVHGKGAFEVQAGSPADGWATIADGETELFNDWQIFRVATTTQYIRFVLLEADAIIGEVVIYGEEVEPVIETKSIRFKISEGENVILDKFISEDMSLSFDFVVEEDDDNEAPTNFPPQISIIPNQVSKQGDSVNFKVNAIDFDGDTLTFSAVGLPEGVNIDPTRGIVQGVISGAIGNYNSTVRVSDGESIVVKSFSWKVEKKDTPPPPPPAPTGTRNLSFDKFLGTNVLGDDPASVCEPIVGNIRVYQWLKWLQKDVSNVNTNAPLSDVKWAFSPCAIGVDLDANYKAFSEVGLTYVTLFESAMYLTGNDKTKLNAVAFNMKDGRNGLDDLHRWTYRAHMAYQFTARYGHNKVPINTLKVESNNEPKTGLGYVSVYEGPNEADRWWIGRDKADLTPEEFAAMMSAEYDGHMGTLSEAGLKFGARTADPNIQVSMGGIAFVDFGELISTGKLDWFDRLFTWFEENRNNPNYETYPLEIVNFHDYPNTHRQQRNLAGRGLYPEGYQWREKHEAFREYLDRRVPSKRLELWNTEFGYDISQDSPQRIEPFGGFNSEQASGFLTVRCFIEMFGVADLATHFYLRDNGENAGGIFASSALTVKPSGYRKRQGYFYFATAKDALKDCVFDSVVERNGNVHVYKLRNTITGKAAYTLHSPTVEGKTSNYNLSLEGNSAEVVKLQDNSLKGNRSTQAGSSINVQVSEMPTFVLER